VDHVVRVEIYVLEREAGHFPDPDTAVQEQADHRVIPPLLELLAGGRFQQRGELGV
jgi:hypothetical protein